MPSILSTIVDQPNSLTLFGVQRADNFTYKLPSVPRLYNRFQSVPREKFFLFLFYFRLQKRIEIQIHDENKNTCPTIGVNENENNSVI